MWEQSAWKIRAGFCSSRILVCKFPEEAVLEFHRGCGPGMVLEIAKECAMADGRMRQFEEKKGTHLKYNASFRKLSFFELPDRRLVSLALAIV